ncbi:hypothetical protein KL921_004717 [Ogataea angusta]|uniref:DUF21-domain-containing protein n=1 Tax=Pichia angusta TaxID=870730 RepID=A0AAN6DCQ0_PICAN|nr:uncharacterized protein KL928_005106 [Ogataea angusta]KAG7806923.1 hypothetical protein KL921_004717 [Ogataea angusta]KAG7816140.1 hypothetical protein KL928_005106 [Ogataea angusta]KAG7821384.1 hypothetical protein KL909_004271 [Ogataea angusta]KAG7827124.1 hypothetical protein KL920_004784 [Ogataea angusta]KAG7835454.1 hypothetical protein KL942_005277 [Ogataea angusta]
MSKHLPRSHASKLPPTHQLYKSLLALVSLLPNLSNALPLPVKGLVARGIIHTASKHHEPLSDGEFYMYMVASISLVLLGGVFAGLTLGLMGQDELYLKVIADSGTPSERKWAHDVLKLIGRGKHWVLVTLLLSNVITNETLPVMLDRFLGGGFAAVFSATASIVIFGEIIPQSVCVRYGLQLGAYFAPFVLVLMYLMYPVAYPIALLLDYILGQDHGTAYRKSGLKTLVTLHKTMGVERLNQDEVTIISAVLDLKEKPVCAIMTPIDKVYTLPSDRILDEEVVEEIFNAGFSRIPIHLPGEPTNFVGMLLVRILISYDPEDALPVSSFPLATLPETSLDTSCLNILNYFQEGKSHMVIVSTTPGMDTGAVGVLTLEDVIEELIGEEIVDESDVYIDVNKNIRRSIPGPLAKKNVSSYLHSLYSSRANSQNSQTRQSSPPAPAYYPKRDSQDTETPRENSTLRIKSPPVEPVHNTQINSTTANGIKPSNLAVNPLQTNNTHVTIKKQPQLDPRPEHVARNYGSAEENGDASADAHKKPTARKLSSTQHKGVQKRFTIPTQKSERSSVDLSDVQHQTSPLPSAASELTEHTVGLPMASSHSTRSNSGIIENIVSVRGVSKTVIGESAVSEAMDIGDENDAGDPTHSEKVPFLKKENGSRPRRDSKRFWDWG